MCIVIKASILSLSLKLSSVIGTSAWKEGGGCQSFCCCWFFVPEQGPLMFYLGKLWRKRDQRMRKGEGAVSHDVKFCLLWKKEWQREKKERQDPIASLASRNKSFILVPCCQGSLSSDVDHTERQLSSTSCLSLSLSPTFLWTSFFSVFRKDEIEDIISCLLLYCFFCMLVVCCSVYSVNLRDRGER